MSSLFKLPNVRNHTSRNGFDLSCKNAFTAKAGELLPVFWKFVLPGDKFNLRVQHFTRTPAVQTAAFTRIKEDFYAYFVPLRLLWRYFPTAINKLYKQVPFASSLTMSNGLINGNLPFTTLAALLKSVNAGANLKDLNGFQRNYQSSKLVNYLGYMYIPDEYNRLVSSGEGIPANPFVDNLKVSPFPLLAYQKIYQDFFRFTQWEEMNSSAYNVDYVGDNGNSNSSYDFIEGISDANRRILTDTGFLSLRYNNWRKDVFTGVFPNSQFGGVSLADAPLTADSVVNGLSRVNSATVGAEIDGKTRSLQTHARVGDNPYMDVSFKNGDDSTSGANLVTGPTTGTAVITPKNLSDANARAQLSILDLRKALATQKLREITQAHDLTIKDQQKAHWNVTLPDSLSGECQFIGNITSDLDINEVVNQNLYGSDNNGRATISGKGTGYDDSRLGSYEAKEFGIVMVIYTATPILDYEAIGTDMQLVKTSVDDFPIPEYDKLGLDTIPSYWLSNCDAVGYPSSSYGWLPRYIDFKSSVDLVRGEFLQTLKSWVAPVSRDILKTTWFGGNVAGWRSFKVNPSVLNPIFGMSVADGTETDQFYINAYFDVKVQRNLDYSGMPY